MGIAVFYQDTKVIFGFQSHYNLWTLLKAIDGIKFSERGARIGNALEEARTKLFDVSARRWVPKMLLVMTDTRSQVSLKITNCVTKFRKS